MNSDDDNIEVVTKRVYDAQEDNDGLRILVDRFWPRGVRKADLRYDIWAKDVTPSDELRRMFHSNPEANWCKFSEEYRNQLSSSDALNSLVSKIRDSKASRVTLLYSFKDKIHNHSLILQQEIINHLK